MEKLTLIQSELKAPKGQYNSFGKYKYRSCEDIQEAVKPLLKKYNVTLTLSDDLQVIGERYYIKVVATLICNETKESVCVTSFAREEETKKGMDGSQVTGASSSYARKYALNGLFLIDDTKDSDATNVEAPAPAPAPLEITTPKKSTLDKARFSGALDSIIKGFYTVEKLRETFELSEEQKAELDKFINEKTK
jgi:hypothetical protein